MQRLKRFFSSSLFDFDAIRKGMNGGLIKKRYKCINDLSTKLVHTSLHIFFVYTNVKYILLMLTNTQRSPQTVCGTIQFNAYTSFTTVIRDRIPIFKKNTFTEYERRSL